MAKPGDFRMKGQKKAKNTELSSLEESIVTMAAQVPASADRILTRKSEDPMILNDLLTLELRAFEKSGRLAEILEKIDAKT